MRSNSDFDMICRMLEFKNLTYEIVNRDDGSRELSIVRGYSGFGITFQFNMDGTFMDIGAYE